MEYLEKVYISKTSVTTNTIRHICATPNLQELSLSFCALETIPDEIGNLSNLNKLTISTSSNSSNIPIELPFSIGNLNNLESIFISLNANQFPVALLGLKNTIVSISINDNIGTIPAEIGEFGVLKVLALNNCGLSNLPAEIQALANTLEELHLVGNNIDDPTKNQIRSWLPNTDKQF